ncbi:hypothetical protein [Paenibacillus lignilyticus]|uniref:GxGYxYP putative glycoside hydrolase second N-terminal domain-containing protein n=1 Tax=Paenibacillus lignilyticus TaxID=1172615 RepID=A0ABS5CIB3_9BACL|nr:hypothetical protein [Paenibacillus lignilyticus]MBP3965600.1 hypothetical protein [Paenibacillus lignilyticus]
MTVATSLAGIEHAIAVDATLIDKAKQIGLKQIQDGSDKNDSRMFNEYGTKSCMYNSASTEDCSAIMNAISSWMHRDLAHVKVISLEKLFQRVNRDLKREDK